MGSNNPSSDPAQHDGEPSFVPTIEYEDISNSDRFMQSLITFLEEATLCVQEVKVRSGIKPECNAPVTMNDEEKKDKMKFIISKLSQRCQEELTRAETQDEEEEQPSPCYCPPDINVKPPKRKTSDRSGKPASASGRDRPDHTFAPGAASSFMGNQSLFSGVPCPTATFRAASRGGVGASGATPIGSATRSSVRSQGGAASASYGTSGASRSQGSSRAGPTMPSGFDSSYGSTRGDITMRGLPNASYGTSYGGDASASCLPCAEVSAAYMPSNGGRTRAELPMRNGGANRSYNTSYGSSRAGTAPPRGGRNGYQATNRTGSSASDGERCPPECSVSFNSSGRSYR